jgi:hypothetical protein
VCSIQLLPVTRDLEGRCRRGDVEARRSGGLKGRSDSDCCVESGKQLNEFEIGGSDCCVASGSEGVLHQHLQCRLFLHLLQSVTEDGFYIERFHPEDAS